MDRVGAKRRHFGYTFPYTERTVWVNPNLAVQNIRFLKLIDDVRNDQNRISDVFWLKF